MNYYNHFFEGFDPDQLMSNDVLKSIGVKNIFHYREKFMLISKNLGAPVRLTVVQLAMSQKNLKRFKDGYSIKKKNWTGTYLLAGNWIMDNCVKTTKESDSMEKKVCLLKVPQSFPEICSMLVAVASECPPNHTYILETMWAESLHLAPDARSMNKDFVEAQWNSWKDPKNPGQSLKFDPEIYEQSCRDKMGLFTSTGQFKNGGPYTCADLDEYLTLIRQQFGCVKEGPKEATQEPALATTDTQTAEAEAASGMAPVVEVTQTAETEAETEAEADQNPSNTDTRTIVADLSKWSSSMAKVATVPVAETDEVPLFLVTDADSSEIGEMEEAMKKARQRKEALKRAEEDAEAIRKAIAEEEKEAGQDEAPAQVIEEVQDEEESGSIPDLE